MEVIGRVKSVKSMWSIILIVALLLIPAVIPGQGAYSVHAKGKKVGGGYAASGQITKMGCTAEIYDATNGLDTSDANYIMGASDGYIWIGGYSGIFRYDGTDFERLDTSDGLTSGRGIFEDSKGRIWVGTNDNGVVLIEGDKRTQYTYKDGLPSSSIRVFAEDKNGNVLIATTAGVAYVNPEGNLNLINDYRINEERVLRLEADKDGRIFGQTKNGIVFAIDDCKVTEVHDGEELGTGKITSILPDPDRAGKLFICTDTGSYYYGDFGDDADHMKRVSVSPISNIHWISYDCGRLWISSTDMIGYVDKEDKFHVLEDLPMNSSIEMTTSDYQGNLWACSSTQGVMKIVANNFVDITGKSGVSPEVTNAVCMHDGKIYAGTDNGLYIFLSDNRPVFNNLTKYIGNARVRCIMEDWDKNLWISTYSNDMGLICYSEDEQITAYTTDNGLPHNEIRSTTQAKDGTILVCTNGGLAFIKDGEVVRTIGSNAEGVKNSIFFNAVEDEDGTIYVGTDGDGIYAFKGNEIEKIGRDEGLTSDVIIRIKWDNTHGLYWIITSNSIQYMKGNDLHTVTSFPYNNNYDMYIDEDDNAWILSSYGLYKVNVHNLINNRIEDFRIYTIENGLPYTITSNSFSFLGSDGILYMAGRYGVIKANIKVTSEDEPDIKIAVSSVYCGNERIIPDENGRYNIPATDERIVISAAVMDYTMFNPKVRMYLEGQEDSGLTVQRSDLSKLEYTGLSYGDYKLHIQVLDVNNVDVKQEAVYDILKSPRFTELLTVRIMLFILVALLVGFIVYKVMHATVINNQYEEIKLAKEEAERANSAKTRFLANISHEIRTPINTIMGMDEMIMREDATDVPKGYFMSMMNYAFDIRNASEALLGLINNLLDMSKIESGKMHLVEVEYDVQDMLRSIISLVRIRSTQKELTFDVVVDEMLPKRLFGDEGKIKQVVVNLLTNAVKYTDIGGFALTVTMIKRVDDRCDICFDVKDTGIGVKEEDMDRLFTAYERLDEEKNSNIQGTGLGLDISRRFAELMGGSLTCESVYGEGSDFKLVVSQKIIDVAPLGIFVEHEERESTGPYVPKFIAPDADVLVVDDNPMNLSVIKGLLRATKVFVTTAASGEECLEKIRDTKFNIVLLDHMMPGMDGVETVGRIREFDTELPVYALTANATLGEDFYKSKGFNGYLSKPVDTEILEKTIMKHLPEEMMEKATEADAVVELKEIPQDLGWIREIPQLSVDDGIKSSGGISSYLFGLQLFYDTIDGNAKVINDAYESRNIRLYTIKVHALKSSARLIGAKDLEMLAANLEEAGNKGDIGFIEDNAKRFMADYMEFKELLAKFSEGAGDEDKEEIPEDELADAYEALKDVIPQMDYDSVEMIIGQLKEYKLPAKDAEKIGELEKMLRIFDWDGMESLISE